MSCALTKGFSTDCRDAVGGIKEIEVFAVASVTYTVVADVVTVITGSTPYKYEFRKQTGNFTETIESSDENGTLFYSQELNIKLSRLETAKRNELFLLAKNDVAVIVTDRMGKKWLLGKENGLQLGGSAESGTAMGDFSGYSLTFTGAETAPMMEVDLV